MFQYVRIAESSASSTAILYARRSRTPDGPASTLHMARVTRLARDPRCYWLPPRKSLPSRKALALRIGLRPFRQVADTWPLGPADNQPNPCSAFLNLFDRLGRRDNGLPGHEPHQQSPASQRHKVRGLLIPLTRNFSIESRVSPTSAGLFERGFISRGARNTRRQKFSSVVRAPSGTSFI